MFSVNSAHSIFFFQAEDGIRDLYVTGVQTCALPISEEHARRGHRLRDGEAIFAREQRRNRAEIERARQRPRSEERRVGKECRCRWSPQTLKNILRNIRSHLDQIESLMAEETTKRHKT